MKSQPTSLAKPRRQQGFALVVTLTLMILLTIIAVGLLTLSGIALRSSSQEMAATTARNNARLAMLLALGELQATLGPDQSVSAPAASVIDNAQQPHLTGAWNSWRWAPTTNGSPSYSQKAQQFRRWLISSTDPQNAEDFSFASASAPTGTNAVELVGDHTTTSQPVPTQVKAEKIPVKHSTLPGNLAWAVFDESIKASIDLGDSTNSTNTSLEVASRTAPDRPRADVLDSKLSALKTPENLISLQTAAIPVGTNNATEIQARFHDFTTGSLGLLTDTANGGLKKDLTSLLEPAPRTGNDPLPEGAFDRPTPYPNGFDTASGAPSWAYIQNHYQKYKNITVSNGIPSYDLTGRPRKGDDLYVIRAGANTGVNNAPDIERVLPVITKLQIAFSMVAHWPFDVSGRRQRLGSNWRDYGAVNLVYDPIITLYNPYDVTLDLSKVRIRIWDPPVAFQFRRGGENGPLFRADAKFVGLAQLQNGFATNPNARKCFTLVLADGDNSKLIESLQLKPGEVRVFSPRVEDRWNWGVETAGGWGRAGAVFFDWNRTENFGNIDRRPTALQPTGISPRGSLGIDCAPGWVARAGLQCDHLADPRNPASRKSFEDDVRFVTMHKSEEVTFEARPQVVSGGARNAQFQVDVLAGLNNQNYANDINSDTTNSTLQADTLRSYRFRFSGGTDLAEELSEDPSDPIIKRTFTIAEILQDDDDMDADKKKPFAMLEMSARYTKDDLNDNKPWLYNNFVVEGGIQNTSEVGLAHQAYDLRFREMTSFDSFPGGIEVDPTPKVHRGYYGAYGNVDEGSSFVNMLHVPLAPAASLGDLIHSNLVSSAQLPRVMHPFGNSRAHPLIPSSAVSSRSGTLMMDHSYLLNDALWDSYYFSSVTNYGGGVISANRSTKEVLTGIFDGTEPAINSRMVPATNPGDPETLADELAGLGDIERSRQLAQHLGVSGAFNVNSASVDAWRAVLSSLRDRAINGMNLAVGNSLSGAKYDNQNETPFVRAGKPLAGADAADHLRWAGFSTLTDTQIEDLAEKIVEEIVNRGEEDSAPSLSIGEFVNRRIGSSGNLHTLAGLLQTAIDKSTINSEAISRDSINLTVSSVNPKRKQGVQTPEVMNGFSAEGAPTMITQGDLMSALAPIATVRGDTFKIRSYGEATSPDGKTILARAWCEAVVQRVPDYVDPTDAPDTALDSLTDANKAFGRRFDIVSFRWLTEEEL